MPIPESVSTSKDRLDNLVSFKHLGQRPTLNSARIAMKRSSTRPGKTLKAMINEYYTALENRSESARDVSQPQQ